MTFRWNWGLGLGLVIGIGDEDWGLIVTFGFDFWLGLGIGMRVGLRIWVFCYFCDVRSHAKVHTSNLSIILYDKCRVPGRGEGSQKDSLN